MTTPTSTAPVHFAPPPNLTPPPPPKKKHSHSIIGWLVALILLAIVVYFSLHGPIHDRIVAARTPATGPSSRPSAPVTTVRARTADLPIYIKQIGTVTALNSVTVRSRVDGQLIKISFAEGQTVTAGQELAEIDPRPFQVAVAQAQAQLAHDQATLKNAQADLTRYQGARDTITQQQLDTQQAVVDQANAVIKTDQALIDSAKLQLSYCSISAPITGLVGLRLVDVGNMVHASDVSGLLVINQVHPITVVFSIPQDDFSAVLKGLARDPHLPVEAYDETDTTLLASGSILAIDNQIDPFTGTVRIKAVFENKDNSLFANQFVMARLLVNTIKSAVVIPNAAHQIGPPPNDNFVYVLKPDSTVELRPIVPGPGSEDLDLLSVTQGLEPGEIVITEGVDKLQPGSKVSASHAKSSSRPSSTHPSAGGTPGGSNRGTRGGTKGGTSRGGQGGLNGS